MHTSTTQPSHLRCGVFELDLTTGELRKAGVLIPLPPQPFKVLALLVSRPGQLVAREEIQQQVWGSETFVDFDHGLNFAIKKIREALGDSAEEPRYIETLPRRGYRFIAPVEAVATASPLAKDVARNHGPAPQQLTHLPLQRRGVAIATLIGVVVAMAAVLVAVNVWGLRDRLFMAIGIGMREGGARSYPRFESLAVLPLANLSGDPSQEYFADGMTEALISEVGQIGALRVISRQSVMHYKGSKEPLTQIAQELNVDALVEGAVLRSGDKVRITAQLIKAVPERHLWARSYERDLRDVLTLQSEIARTIAEGIKAKVAPDEQARLTRPHSVNPEAYELYLKGNDWLRRGDRRTALDYFQQAVQKDPDFARAYFGMAWVYNALGTSIEVPSMEAFAKVKGFAQKALELDDSLAEAHVMLADALSKGGWDWAGAERELNLALELNPNSDDAHRTYSRYFRLVGRYQESVAEAKRAMEINPFPADPYVILGMAHYFGRRFDEALTQLQKAQQITPTPAGFLVLGWVYREKGMYKEALKEIRQSREGLHRLGHLGNTYARMGDKAAAHGAIEKLVESSAKDGMGAYEVAIVYAALGEKDRAFEWLERAYKVHDNDMWFLKVDPPLDPLRSDLRFQDLLRRMNFPL